MIEFRWLKVRNKKPMLQARYLLWPTMVASGDIVLTPNDAAQWFDVPTVTEAATVMESVIVNPLAYVPTR